MLISFQKIIIKKLRYGFAIVKKWTARYLQGRNEPFHRSAPPKREANSAFIPKLTTNQVYVGIFLKSRLF
jgi:hypothetical protein